jgi:hypothetical protein
VWSRLGRGVLRDQRVSKLDGIRTLLQSNDQPVLQCPHVRETSSEPSAGSSDTPEWVPSAMTHSADPKNSGPFGDELVKVREEATEKITQHTVKTHGDGTVRK